MPSTGSVFLAGEQLGPADGKGRSGLPLPQRDCFGEKESSARPPVLAAVALMGIIERLDCLLDRENAILREHRLADLEEHNQKKSLGLLEMRRAIDAVRGFGCETLGLETKPAVARLREKLQSNLSLLRTHLEAIAAITAAIARTIEQQESDGTYLPGHVSKASRS